MIRSRLQLQKRTGNFVVQRFQTNLLIKTSGTGSWMNGSFFSLVAITTKQSNKVRINLFTLCNFFTSVTLTMIPLFCSCSSPSSCCCRNFLFPSNDYSPKNTFRLLLICCAAVRFVETDRQTTDSPMSMQWINWEKFNSLELPWQWCRTAIVISNAASNLLNTKRMSIVSTQSNEVLLIKKVENSLSWLWLAELCALDWRVKVRRSYFLLRNSVVLCLFKYKIEWNKIFREFY